MSLSKIVGCGYIRTGQFRYLGVYFLRSVFGRSRLRYISTLHQISYLMTLRGIFAFFIVLRIRGLSAQKQPFCFVTNAEF